MRYHGLQILRGFAAWSVVLHHIAGLTNNYDYGLGYFLKYGGLGVDVFFVLSGFVMYLTIKSSTKSGLTFAIDRFLRIAPNYYLYSLITAVCIILIPGSFYYTDFNFASLLFSFSFIPHLNPSGFGMYPLLTQGWTLNFEIFFYLIISLCILLPSKYTTPATIFCLVTLPLIYPNGIFYSRISASFLLYEFALGLLIAHLASSFTITKEYKTIKIAACIFIIFIIFRYLPPKLSSFLFAGFTTLLFSQLDNFINLKSRIIKFLIQTGSYSYSTYLSHTIVIGILIHIMGKPNSGMPLAVFLSLCLVITYSASILSFKYIESSQYIKNLKLLYHTRK